MMATKRKEMALANKKQSSPPKSTPSPPSYSVLGSTDLPTTTTSLPEETARNSDISNEEKLFDGGFFRITSPASSRQVTPVFACKSKPESSSTPITPAEKYVLLPLNNFSLILIDLFIT